MAGGYGKPESKDDGSRPLQELRLLLDEIMYGKLILGQLIIRFEMASLRQEIFAAS
jgi:hypothetical protein